MHTGAKVTLAIGGVVFLLGLVMVIFAGTAIDSAGSEWAAENSNGASLVIVDDDGQGDLGVSFWVQADYIDADGDGSWDHCDGIEITITEKPDTGFWDEGLDGDFYFQASTDGSKTCNVEDGAEKGRGGFAKVGRGCLACFRGEMEFESNQPVWVTYDDEVLGDLFGGIFAGVGGGSCLCCGALILLLGLILALTMKEEAPTTYQVDAEGRVIQIQGGEVPPDPVSIAPESEVSADESSTATEEWYKQTE
jgi:hypothetical protein